MIIATERQRFFGISMMPWIFQRSSRWCRKIGEVDTIDLVNPRRCSRTIRTKAAIQNIKRRLNRRKPLSSRKLARELGISSSSVQRILKNALELQAYKMQIGYEQISETKTQ